jgi:tetratricopeptide (TPR) repeat protein
LVLAGLSLVACASANKAALRRTSVGPSRSFAVGDFGKAIDLHRGLYEKDPQNAKIVVGYVAEVEAVKRAGDRARRRGNFLAAQRAYRALIDDWDAISAIAGKLGFRRTDLEAGLRDCRIATYRRLFRQELLAGHHDGALAVYQDAAREYPGDMSVKTMYAKGVGEIRAMGAKALAARDFALAGKITGLLLNNLDSFGGLWAPAEREAAERKDLTDALHACSFGLATSGLAEFRKGNLDKAIALWADALAFDPENLEIRAAVEAAKTESNPAPGSGPVSAVKDGGVGGGKSGHIGQRTGYY